MRIASSYGLITQGLLSMQVSGSVVDIINRTSLGLMKSSAVLIPLARQNVDYGALHDTLAAGAIGGAILDTWPDGCWGVNVECGAPYGSGTEPYAGTGSFKDLPNVKMTPMVMMQTEQFWDNSAKFCGANLKAFVDGRPLQGIVRNITSGVVA
jgi:lactate dehydrogenase-like 2-hydroxyacid dehydrogenase